MYNHVELMGNLAKDALVRSLGEERCIIMLRVGTDYRSYHDDKEHTHTEWFNVEFTATVRQTDYYKKHFRTGAMIHAAGRMQTDEWTGNDGTKNSSSVVKCHIKDVQCIRPARKSPATQTASKPAPDPKQRTSPDLPSGQNDAKDRENLVNF